MLEIMEEKERKNLIHKTKSAWLQTLTSLIMKMMIQEQFGIKKLEKETKIECPRAKRGEQYKQQCQTKQ